MSLRINILANYIGQGAIGLMGIFFAPWYIKYLGVEAYGLIGIFLALQAWLVLLDMGMTPMLSREVARMKAGVQNSHAIRDLLYSIELIYVTQITIVVVGAWWVAPWLEQNWVSAQQLRSDTVTTALIIIVVVAALRWFSGLYRGAMIGLQQQVWLNSLLVGCALVRFGGAVLVLAWWSSTIEAFFLWQLAVSIIESLILKFKVGLCLPNREYVAHFSIRAIKSVWKFAAGTTVTSVLVLMLTQIDKVLLTKMLTLESFGKYTLASTVAGALAIFISPVSAAVYPRLTELHSQSKHRELASIYHYAAQLVTVSATPAALMLIFWGESILGVWTGNAKLANEVAPILAALALGGLLNGYMHVPYMLQLASGWPSFAAWMNSVAVILMVPLILWSVPIYGAVGAAFSWMILNLGYVILAIHLMHRRLLPSEKWSWYLKDILFPAFLSFLVIGSLSFLDWGARSNVATIMMLIGVLFLGTLAALLASTYLRRALFFAFAKYK